MLIDSAHPDISIICQCDLLDISRSGYYYKPATESPYNLDLMRLIDEIYTKFPYYGYRRITQALRREDYNVNHKRIQRLMHKMGIQGICPKKKYNKVLDGHKKYPYLLKGMNIDRPNLVWCSDITYIRLLKGFVYLVAVMDWFSRFVLSWEISNTLDTYFCMEALERALKLGKPEIFNTDQGPQFTSESFTGRLETEGITISMDGRGRTFDNIFIERLWRSVKYEEVYVNDYQTVPDVVNGIGNYFPLYNYERLHQSLDYKTPAEIHYAYF
jgi:putative transposase